MATAKAAKATTVSTPRKRTPAKPKAEAAAKPAAKRATSAKTTATAKAAAPAAPKKRVAKPKAVVPVVVEKQFDESAFSEQVARLAYQYWQERGCPEGSPHEDWYRAEESLLGRQV